VISHSHGRVRLNGRPLDAKSPQTACRLVEPAANWARRALGIGVWTGTPVRVANEGEIVDLSGQRLSYTE